MTNMTTKSMRTTLLTIIMMLVTANGFSLHPRPDLLVSISPSYHHNSSSKVRFRLMRLTLNATNQNDAIGARERMKQARLDYEASCLIREEEAAEVDDDLEALEAREVKKAFKGSSVERNDTKHIQFMRSLRFKSKKGTSTNPIEVREKMRARWVQSSVRPDEGVSTHPFIDGSLEEFESETLPESEGLQVEQEIAEASKEEIPTADSEESITSSRNTLSFSDGSFEQFKLETRLEFEGLQVDKRLVTLRRSMMIRRFDDEARLFERD